MSKLYDRYLYLKNLDKSKIYLIKSGIFYISLDEDALELAEKFNFKLTNLNDSIIKCGFPETRLQYYTNLLDVMNIKYEVDTSQATFPKSNTLIRNNKNFIDKIASLDLDAISFKEAHNILCSLNTEALEILSQLETNKP